MGQTADHLIGSRGRGAAHHRGHLQPGKERIREYTPSRMPKLGGGSANRYAKFLVEELKPFIDFEYRTMGDAANTGLGGSSLGGLVSLYVGLKFSQVYGKVAALSPSVWWNQRVMHRFAATVRVGTRPRIWLDIGTAEGQQIVRDVENFRDVLLQKGWQLGADLHYELVEGAEHNEAAWASRIGNVLQFLFPVSRSDV